MPSETTQTSASAGKIRAFMARHIRNVSLRDDEDVFAAGFVNSLFAMQLVTFVEGEFSIVAERGDLDIRNFCSIAALIAFVEAKLGLHRERTGTPTWTSN